jgi:hypothetical protein
MTERGTMEAYEAPVLVELGSLEDLTQGGSSFGTDFKNPAPSAS